jgi:hypothetical protein
VRQSASRAALRRLVISLARDPSIVEFSRRLVQTVEIRDRLARLAALFTFVCHLVDVPPHDEVEVADGVDLLLRLAGEDEGPAVILAALLQAVGERAAVEVGLGVVFVRVQLELGDLKRLPPHTALLVVAGRYYLPLDARGVRKPLGFLPLPVRQSLPVVRSARPRMAVIPVAARRR